MNGTQRSPAPTASAPIKGPRIDADVEGEEGEVERRRATLLGHQRREEGVDHRGERAQAAADTATTTASAAIVGANGRAARQRAAMSVTPARTRR